MLSPDGHTRSFDAERAGHRVQRRRRGGAAEAAVGRAAPTATRSTRCIRGAAVNNDGGDQGQLHRAEHRRPGRGDRDGARSRRRRRAPHFLRRGARHRHAARRSDRDRGPDPGVPPQHRRARLLRDRLGEEQRRPPGHGRRRRRRDQDRAGAGRASCCRRSLHFDAPNPKIDFANSPFVVNDRAAPWHGDARPAARRRQLVRRRRHQRARDPRGGAAARAVRRARKARNCCCCRRARRAALGSRGRSAWPTHLAAQPDANLADVAWTLRAGRKAFAHRAAVVADDVDDAVAALARRRRRRRRRAAHRRRAPRRRASCSRARARSTPAWAASCTRASRRSAPRSTSAAEVLARRARLRPARAHVRR